MEQGEMLVGFYGPLTRGWEFAAGALLALAPSLLAPRSRRLSLAQGAVGTLLLAASVALISADTPFPGLWTLLPVVGTMLLIRSGGSGDHVIARSLRSTPMVRVGDLSYSIYLWHWPFIVFAAALWPRSPIAALVAAVVSVGPAVASYRWVEEPIREMELPSARRAWRLVSFCVVPPVLLALALGAASARGFWSSTVRAHQAAVLEPHHGCHGYTPLSGATSASCSWNRSAEGAPIYLVGDSHARHFSEAVIRAGSELGRPVVVATASSCPLLDAQIRDLQASDVDNASCRSYAQGTLAHLRRAVPGLVVLTASDQYWSEPMYAVRFAGSWSTEKRSKGQVLSGGVRR